MLSLEMRDDRSEKVRYDYTDYPIYIRRALLSSYPGYAAPIGTMILNLLPSYLEKCNTMSTVKSLLWPRTKEYS